MPSHDDLLYSSGDSMLDSVTPSHMSGHETLSGPVVHNGSHHYQGWSVGITCCRFWSFTNSFLTCIHNRSTRFSRLPSQNMAITERPMPEMRFSSSVIRLTPRY